LMRVIERLASFDAPLEQVGGALEQALVDSDRWALGGVQRERATLTASLRAGLFPWVDPAEFQLKSGEAQTTEVEIILRPAVPWAFTGLRRGHLSALIQEVESRLGQGAG